MRSTLRIFNAENSEMQPAHCQSEDISAGVEGNAGCTCLQRLQYAASRKSVTNTEKKDNVRNFVRFNTPKNNSGLLNEAFFEEGYADDYVGDGLNGKDNYIGDGLDE